MKHTCFATYVSAHLSKYLTYCFTTTIRQVLQFLTQKTLAINTHPHIPFYSLQQYPFFYKAKPFTSTLESIPASMINCSNPKRGMGRIPSTPFPMASIFLLVPNLLSMFSLYGSWSTHLHQLYLSGTFPPFSILNSCVLTI